MTIRTSLGEYVCAAVVLIAGLGGANTVLGQQEVRLDTRTAAPMGVSLGVEAAVPDEDAGSSVEEGQTHLAESFSERQLRLEERRGALRDTKFEFNLRTYYFDRNKFDGSESQAWAIGGWAGLKTGYFRPYLAWERQSTPHSVSMARRTRMEPSS